MQTKIGETKKGIRGGREKKISLVRKMVNYSVYYRHHFYPAQPFLQGVQSSTPVPHHLFILAATLWARLGVSGWPIASKWASWLSRTLAPSLLGHNPTLSLPHHTGFSARACSVRNVMPALKSKAGLLEMYKNQFNPLCQCFSGWVGTH